MPLLPHPIVTIAPLCIFLIATTVYECRTGLIPDRTTIPAAFYFVVTSSFLGPPPWWQYALASVLVLATALALAFGYAKWTGHEGLGGGAIKLLSAVAGALGIVLAARLIAVFLLLVVISVVFVRVISSVRAVPSSPLVFLSTLTVVGQAAWTIPMNKALIAFLAIAQTFPIILILLVIAALVLDTVNSYIRICVRQSAAYGVAHFNVPSQYLFRFIHSDLPEILRSSWVVPAVFGTWLIVGLVLLIYGIVAYGFLIGLGMRLIPWVVGRLVARVIALTLIQYVIKVENELKETRAREGHF